MRKIAIALGALGVGLVSYFLVYGVSPLQENSAATQGDVGRHPVDDLEHQILESSGRSVDTSIESLRVETNLIEELVQSTDDVDRDTREAAIRAVEKEMSARLQTYPNGWVRWQPVIIDQNDLTNGDYLDENTVAKEFLVTLFHGHTYRATRALPAASIDCFRNMGRTA